MLCTVVDNYAGRASLSALPASVSAPHFKSQDPPNDALLSNNVLTRLYLQAGSYICRTHA